MTPPPPRSTLFPYTTLFRSTCRARCDGSQKASQARRRQWDGESVFRLRGIHDRREYLEVETPILHPIDRKSTRLNSSHTVISYAVFCLKKKKKKNNKI